MLPAVALARARAISVFRVGMRKCWFDAEQRKRADGVSVGKSVDDELVKHSKARQPESMHVEEADKQERAVRCS